MPRLTRLDWPDNGRPDLPPPLTLVDYRQRLSRCRAAMAARGLEGLALYGDREHSANLHWLTGFDPRFEEALLILLPDRAALLVGNECLPYAQVSPLVAAGDIGVLHVPALSLVSQPREGLRLTAALAAAMPAGLRLGVVGWKYFGPQDFDDPASALDLPAFLADPLRARAGRVEAASDLFMHPGHGLRTRVDAAGIARLEFANAMAVRATRRLIAALRPGATDFDVIEAAGIGGLPLGCHVTLATGAMAHQGMASASGQRIEVGRPISFNICHWGANICRAGWLAHSAADLPAPARDYVETFAGPYVAAMSAWCGMMRPGVSGGEVWLWMRAALPFQTFGVTLNPGHLIDADEWVSSPIAEDSDIPLASGMAMQMDVIPDHPVYGSTRMEDGYVLADDALRADLRRQFPQVAERIARRAAFLRDVIGMDIPDTLLPLADTCGIVAPFLLDPGQVITLR